MNRFPRSLLTLVILALPPLLIAQPALKKDVAMIYTEICANCHGKELEGAQAPSLLDDVWAHGNGNDASIATVIRDGALDKGMPAFHSLMTEGDIRTMVIFIREQRAKYSRSRVTRKTYPTGTQTAAGERFRIETVADNLATPWSMAFLPDGRMLVTEKPGRLRVVEHGKLLPAAITGTPAVRDEGQGGLLEVAVHPQYAGNGWIYLAYSDPAKDEAGKNVSLTTLVRGRIKDGAWTDQETIWRAPPEFYRTGGGHFGCRIAFDGRGYLFFSHGERGRGPEAQELPRPNGKIHRIHDDGRIPADNPFVGTPGAFPSIWTYGNRNPQGLDFDPRTGVLWETEHGPRGGDEVNIIRAGRNYGWPVITYGMNYDGSALTDRTTQDGMEQPVTYWTPSIAVCGIDFYEGRAFPQWTGNLFVTALAQQELRRLVIEGEQVVRQDVILKDLGRLRDVASGPDGAIYVAVNDPGRIIRLVPVK